MDHGEQFPKGSTKSSEVKQENDPKVPMRIGNKYAASNLSEGPFVGTEADWCALTVDRKGTDKIKGA